MSLINKVKRELGEYFFSIESIKLTRREEAFAREYYPKQLLPMAISIARKTVRKEYFFQGLINLIRLAGVADLLINKTPYILSLNETLRVLTYCTFHPSRVKQKLEITRNDVRALTDIMDENKE